MHNLPKTDYSSFANQTLDWLPMDTLELYQKNFRENPHLLKELGWTTTSITYKFNSYGFRSEEFTDESTVMFLGCSHTCGIGLPYEEIWPTVLAKKLNMQSANLGIGGASPDTAFRLCHGYIDIVKPKIVVFLVNPGLRAEFFPPACADRPVSLIAQQHSNHNYFKLWMQNGYNYLIQKQRNISAIKGLCLEKNIKFVVHESENIVPEKNDFARDLVHFGRKTHAKIAEIIFAKI